MMLFGNLIPFISGHINWRCRKAFSCGLLVMMTGGCGEAPDSPVLLMERGRMQLQRGYAEEAVPLFTRVLAQQSDNAEAYYQRGLAFESLGVPERALMDYTECLSLNDLRLDARNNKAVVLAKLERYAEAVQEFRALVEQNPDDALAWRNRALCHFDLGRHDDALADYAKAIELNPDDASSWYQRGNVFKAQEQFDKAESDYSKAIQLEADLALAWANRGVVRHRLGRKQEARQDLEKAMSLDDRIVVPDPDFSMHSQTATANSTQLSIRTAAEDILKGRGYSEIQIEEDASGEFHAVFTANRSAQPVRILVVVPDATGRLLFPAPGAPVDLLILNRDGSLATLTSDWKVENNDQTVRWLQLSR